MWIVEEAIELPVYEGNFVVGSLRKNPGDKISVKEMTDAGQTDDQIAALVKAKAIKEDS